MLVSISQTASIDTREDDRFTPASTSRTIPIDGRREDDDDLLECRIRPSEHTRPEAFARLPTFRY
jgi:hypothetical protein